MFQTTNQKGKPSTEQWQSNFQANGRKFARSSMADGSHSAVIQRGYAWMKCGDGARPFLYLVTSKINVKWMFIPQTNSISRYP